MVIVYSYVSTEKNVEGFHMTPKKIKMFFLAISFVVTTIFFIKYLVVVLMYFKDPLGFSFTPIFIGIGLMIAMVLHLGGYVLIMEEKQKVRKVEDIENWWEKWDRV